MAHQRKLLFIVNPIAGTRNKQLLHQHITSAMQKASLPFAIFPSVASGDYSFLDPILIEEKFTDIIIAGGDGTINQAINGLRAHRLPFGIIPCGSGNGLALSAAIPKNPTKALQLLLEGTPKLTDAFLINDTFACMLSGIGLDAQVAHDFANDPRRGLTTYVRKTVRNFLTARSFPFIIDTPEHQLESEAYFISIANSNQFGNNFTIAPEASLHDGLLDIVVMTKQNKLSMLLQSLLQVTGFNKVQETGLLKQKSSVLYFQTASLRIRNPARAPLHIDGDPVDTDTVLDISILKDCFSLICP